MVQINSGLRANTTSYSNKQNNKQNFRGESDFSDQDYKDIHNAEVSSACWSTFFGFLPAIIYAFKNPKNEVSCNVTDKNREYKKQIAIKSGQIKTSIISGVIGIAASIVAVMLADASIVARSTNSERPSFNPFKLNFGVMLISLAARTVYGLYVNNKKDKDI